MAKLKAVNVTFHTSDDDKRQESSIDMVLNDTSNNGLAWAAGSYGKFDNWTTNGPFGLQVLIEADKSKISPGGLFVLS